MWLRRRQHRQLGLERCCQQLDVDRASTLTYPARNAGFALPSILIAGIVMIIVMLAAVQAGASVRVALDNQYYDCLAREAGQSGIVLARACLEKNNYIPQWTDAKPLRPNTDCAGNDRFTCPVTPSRSDNPGCFIVADGDIRTSFTIKRPVGNGVTQQLNVISNVALLRRSNGVAYKSFSNNSSAQVGADLSFANVAFGYSYFNGAFFATIGADGVARVVGANAWGQQGNGTTTNSTTPRTYQLPAGEVPVRAFTNFVSQGFNLFVLTASGKVYGAGSNDHGQLGDGTKTDRSTPVRFQLPAGKVAKSVDPLGYGTYVTTTDGNIYAAGACIDGALGSNYPIDGCSDATTPVRVNLPTPNGADLNTLPARMVLDWHSVIVLMQGGRVYGWGENVWGLLGTGDNVRRSSPVQIGTFGNPGQPKATQLAFDGNTTHIVDDLGRAWASGENLYGSLAGAAGELRATAGVCMDVEGGATAAGTKVIRYACNHAFNQKFEWHADGTLRYRPDAATDLCVDNNGNVNTNGNPIIVWYCNNGPAQQWQLRDDFTIVNPNYNRCIDNPGAGTSNFTQLYLWDCNPGNAWYPNYGTWTLGRVPIPASAGKVTKVTTDQHFVAFLTDSGEVWGGGWNERGVLGSGTASKVQVAPVKFQLPSGVKGVDLYATSVGVAGDAKYNNLFVVGDNGKVYGAGSNVFGQLGDGTTTDRSTPVAMQVIDGLTIRAQSAQAGFGTAVIFTTDGKIFTVGNNANGQLGDGTTTNRSIPAASRYLNNPTALVY